MTQGRTNDLGFGQLIHEAWKETGLALSTVLFQYKTRALEVGIKPRELSAVKSWCYGKTAPQLHHYEVLEHVINGALEEAGKSRMLPCLMDTAAVRRRGTRLVSEIDPISITEHRHHLHAVGGSPGNRTLNLRIQGPLLWKPTWPRKAA